MTPEQLEDLAIQGGPVPEGITSQTDMLLFLEFRSLYQFARMNPNMSREQGKREKAQILNTYRIGKFLEEIQEETVQIMKDVELAVSEYHKNPTLETADRVIDIFYHGTKSKQRPTHDV